ncbi:AfsR/SARP family transcriptional regulator [Mesorhizobium helmanticense]|nr:BTAD domain-containing putative transcriptional regulator [Mesorhizobium helmanticense]
MSVNLLGEFGISVDGRRIHSDLGRSGRKMAALLFAFPGRLYRRERIADLCWPELDPERSRAALNSALWRLRQILCQDPSSERGQNLRSIGSDIVLEPQSWLKVDSCVLAGTATLASDQIETSQMPCMKSIRSAIDLYDGQFLEAEDFDQFAAERERIHTCFVNLSTIALERYASAGAYPDAISICHKVLSFDPFHELFIRRLIALLFLNEQRAGALRFYEKWKSALRAEIGVDPMPNTARVGQQVRCCQSPTDFDEIRQIVFSSEDNGGA